MIQFRWTVHAEMQFFGFIAILLLALSACIGEGFHAHFSPFSHRTLVTVDSLVLEYAGRFYELSTFGMDLDQVHRIAAESY